MAYKRKTRDLWDTEQDYGQGWECVDCNTEWFAARESAKTYRANVPGIPTRIRHYRERIES